MSAVFLGHQMTSKGYNVNALILDQFLATNPIRKCMENSMENLYVDIQWGFKG